MTRLAQYLFAVLVLGACSSPGATPSNPDVGGDGGGGDASTDARPGKADDGTPARDVGSDADALDADDATSASDIGTDIGADTSTELRDEALLAALRDDAMQTHNPLGYRNARDQMYKPGGIDDDGGRIEGIYTGRTVDTDGSRTPGDNCELADGTPSGCAFNTEHTMALYYLRLELGDSSPEFHAAEGDIHHLFPSWDRANTYRYHFPFGTTDCEAEGNCRFDEESQLGLPVGVDGDPGCSQGDIGTPQACVMMVRPERRGDVARAQFYMSMRYGIPIEATSEATMREWNDVDPPDAREEARNAGIASVQGNRNPFIDAPDLVDRISDF